MFSVVWGFLGALFTNSWVISIVCGVIVFFLTDGIKKQINNKEYKRNIQFITSEIVNVLQEFVVENDLPPKSILESYYEATCRKYKVKIDDAESFDEIFNRLVKEILDSSFISKADKTKYCEEVINKKHECSAIPPTVIIDRENKVEEKREKEKEKENEREIQQNNKFVSFATAIFFSILIFIVVDKYNSFNILFDVLRAICTLLFILLIIVIVIVFIAELMRKRKRS